MKVKLIGDPYLSWEGMDGVTLNAFVDKLHPNGVFVNIEEANKKGATDNPSYGIPHRGHRYLMNGEYEVLEDA